MTTMPNFENAVLSFEPASYWYPGEYDPATLVDALKAKTPLADFEDAHGNMQSAVRLDADEDPANAGYWITVPAETPQSVIDACVAAYQPPGPPPPADPLVPASVAVETAVAAAMATVSITSPNLTAQQLQQIQTKVQQQVQAVVDTHLAG